MSIAVQSSVRDDYANVLRKLRTEKVPFVVGGAWAVEHYVALGRATLDLDLMLDEAELERATKVLADEGVLFVDDSAIQRRVALRGAEVDLVHHLAQGGNSVDHEWYDRGRIGKLFGASTLFAAPEELIWSKAFIAARTRFDGADVVHLLRATHRSLDWGRLRGRFGAYPELLLAHLSLFVYCYPSEREPFPRWLVDELLGRLETASEPSPALACLGPLLDRASFDFDLLAKGFVDVRANSADSTIS